MILYQGTILEFNEDVMQNRIADRTAERYCVYYNRNPGEAERRSWTRSLTVLNNSFIYSGLKDNYVVVEYELPYTSRRIDVLLFGKDYENNQNIILMELKQWSNDNVDNCASDGNVCVDYGRFRKEVPHPSLQVQGYHFDLKDFLTIFSESDAPELSSCAYCHEYAKNKKPDVLFSAKFDKERGMFPIFAKEDASELGRYLKKRLSGGNGMDVFNRFIISPIAPSRKLLDHTNEMINKRQIFNLIDDQIASYNAIMHRVKKLAKSIEKSVIIVKGGPGTGKSVIALEVMGELLRQGKTVMHATGSSAFTNTLRKIVGNRAKKLFNFFFSYTKEPDNSIDVLICDEAHRIRKDSNDYGVPARFRSRAPQVDDLIRPAKLSVFFIDEYQIVRPKEQGSVSLIKNAAKKWGIEDKNISEFELQTQFRCSGSDAFLQWLEHVLEIRDTEITKIDTKMEFRIFDNPSEMLCELKKRNLEKPNKSRIVAGFCWPWSEPNPDGSLINDVRIGNFEMPWENKNKFWMWATDSSGMEQVGTVYTAQGMEFEYIAVIFGNDLVYDLKEKKWKAVPDNSYDTQITRNNPDLVSHLKNVYRVLMSRAHKGVYVYFMDKDTENYFKSKIKNAISI